MHSLYVFISMTALYEQALNVTIDQLHSYPCAVQDCSILMRYVPFFPHVVVAARRGDGICVHRTTEIVAVR